MSIRNPSVPVVMFVLIVAELTSAFEMSMIYAALASLYKIYGDPVGVGWLITAFLLVSAAAAAICGRLGDIYGRSRVLVIMLIMAGVGSLISAVATSLEWIIVGRSVQGVAAAILPLCFGLVRERIPVERVPLCIGIIAGTATLGAALGYLLGGLIVDIWPWQYLFWVSAVFAVVALVLVLAILPVSPRSEIAGSRDFIGGVLFVPAIAGVLFAVSRIKIWGLIDTRTLGLLAISLALLAFWVWHELRQEKPLINVRLFADRQIVLANLGFGLVAFGAMQSQMIILPLMQQPEWTMVGLGVSATVAGMIKAGSSIFGTMGAPFSGYLAGRSGARTSMLWGTIICTAGLSALIFYNDSLVVVAACAGVAALGMGMVYAAGPNLIVEVVPADRVSEATGLTSVVRAVMGAIGAQTIAFILASSTISDPSHGTSVFPSGEAYTWAFVLVAVASLSCVFVTLLLPRRRPQQAGQGDVAYSLGKAPACAAVKRV